VIQLGEAGGAQVGLGVGVGGSLSGRSVAVGRGVLVGPTVEVVGVTNTGVGRGVRVSVGCEIVSPLGLILRSQPINNRAAMRMRVRLFVLKIFPMLIFLSSRLY
jgi:hypothetical protein